MSGMNEYTPDLFELIDEKGNKKNFELIDVADLDGEQYYAMIPAVEDDEFLTSDCELVILKSVYENGEEILASIEEDDEFDKVSAFFMERIETAISEIEEDNEFAEEFVE